MKKSRLSKFISAAVVFLMVITVIPQNKVYAKAETQFFSHSEFTETELKDYQGAISVNTDNKYGNTTPKLVVETGTVSREFEPITSGKVYFSGIFLYESGSEWIRIKNSAGVTLINVEGAKSGNINLNGSIGNKTTGGPLGGGLAASNGALKKAATKKWQMIAIETDLDQKEKALKFKMTVYLTTNYKGADTDWGIPVIVKDIPVADTNENIHTDLFDIAKIELISNKTKAFYIDDLTLSTKAPKLPEFDLPVAETQFFNHSDFTENELKEYQGDKALNIEDKYGNITPKLVVKSDTVTREFKPITSGKVYLSCIFLYQSGSQWIRLKNSADVTLINVGAASSGNINLTGLDNITTGGPLDGGVSASNQGFKKANVGTKTWQMVALETDLDQKENGLKFKMTVYVTDNYKGAETDWGIPAVVKDIPVADTNATIHTNTFDISKIQFVSDATNAFFIDDLALSNQAPKLPEYTIPKTEEEKNLENDVLELENYLVEYIKNPLVTFEGNLLKVDKRTLILPSTGKYKTPVEWSVESPSQHITIKDNLLTLIPSSEAEKLVNIVANFSVKSDVTKETYTASKTITVAMPKAPSSGNGSSLDLSNPQVLQKVIKNMQDNGVFENIESLPNKLNVAIKTEEFITILLNQFNVDTEYTQVAINKEDIDYNAWYAKYVIAAFQLSIEKNPDKNIYGIGETITKDELCTIIKRMVAIDQGEFPADFMTQIVK